GFSAAGLSAVGFSVGLSAGASLGSSAGLYAGAIPGLLSSGTVTTGGFSMSAGFLTGADESQAVFRTAKAPVQLATETAQRVRESFMSGYLRKIKTGSWLYKRECGGWRRQFAFGVTVILSK